MNQKVKRHVAEYCQKCNWPTDEESIIKTIRSSKKVYKERLSWGVYFMVVVIDGMYIGFTDTVLGKRKFDPDTICEVVAVLYQRRTKSESKD